MQRRLLAPCLVLSGLVSLAAPARAQEAPERERLVDGIAAQVGSDIVLVSDVIRRVAPIEDRMREAGVPETEIAKLRAQGLEQLIEASLVQRIVRQSELYASDEEIDRTIQAIADENGLTLAQLEASVAFHGMSFEDYRQQIKRDLERTKVVSAAIGAKIRVEESEVKALYEERFANQPTGGDQVHLRQILISLAENSPAAREAACAQARAVRERVLGGEVFEEVAQEVSAVAPQHGGDIGWLHADSLAPWMAELVAPLGDGEVSEVVALPFGCTLLKLVERREYSPVSYEMAEPRLQQEIYETKRNEKYAEWLEELREKTYIERRGYFAEAAKLTDGVFSGTSEAAEEEEPVLP